MNPPVDIRDRSDYRRRMVISDWVASMRGLDHHWMALELMSRSIAWAMTVDEFKAKVQAAKLLQLAAAH